MSRKRESTLTIETPEGVIFSFELATPVTRALAWAVDMAAIGAVNYVPANCSTPWPNSARTGSRPSASPCTSPSRLHTASCMEWRWRGQTIGKRLLGLRVIDAQGLRLQWSQVALRNLFRVVDMLPLTYLIGGSVALFTRYGQRLGDLAANTVVAHQRATRAPDLEQIAPAKYNSLLGWPNLAARLRAAADPDAVAIAVQAVTNRDGYDPLARIDCLSRPGRLFPQPCPLPRSRARRADRRTVRAVRSSGHLHSEGITMKPAILVFLSFVAVAAPRQVAITIDDLPRGGDDGPRNLAAIRAMTQRLLKPFREQKIPVIGFVNAGRQGDFPPQGLREILDLWLDSGATLGNHSYSHLNINNVPLEQYTADIVKGEPALRAALSARGQKLEFYRHPFLFTGPTLEIKRGLQQFLDEHSYRVAPVTLDNNDWEYAALYTRTKYRDRVKREYLPYMESIVAFFEQRSVEVVGREIPQILLIHASQLNADLMPGLLEMFRRRGYSFISLQQALADEAYRLPEEYAGPTAYPGFTAGR